MKYLVELKKWVDTNILSGLPGNVSAAKFRAFSEKLREYLPLDFVTRAEFNSGELAIFRFIGSVETAYDLSDIDDPVRGDVYIVVDEQSYYAFDGEKFNPFYLPMDLSNYLTKDQAYTKTQIDELLKRLELEAAVDLYDYPSSPTNVAVGNIPVGYTSPQGGITASELIYLATHKDENPISTLTITPVAGYKKIGTPISNIKLSCTATRKTFPIVSIKFYKNTSMIENISIVSENTKTYPFNVTESIIETTTFKAIVQDSKGNTSTASQTYSFVHPMFIGSSSKPINMILENDIISLTELIRPKENTSRNFTHSNQFRVFAYPKTHGELSSILDANNFPEINGFSQKELAINGIIYLIYTSKIAATLTNFKTEFKF